MAPGLLGEHHPDELEDPRRGQVLLAYLHPDRAPLSMTDEVSVRALVRRHLVPALSLPSTSPTTR